MSFLKGTSTFTRFKIIDPVPDALWGELHDKLRQYSFHDIDDVPEDRSWGWTAFEDMLDTNWNGSYPLKGDYVCFTLRLDTRRVPPAVIKKQLRVAEKAEEAALRERGKTYISRERRKELKEQVILRLKQRFLPIPAEFQVVWNRGKGVVYFASTQSKVLELFQEHFSLTFQLDLNPMTPYELALDLLDAAGRDALESLEGSSFV